MSDISYENKNKNIRNESEILHNYKEKILQSNEKEIIENEKNVSDIYDKHKLSTDLPDTSSSSESPREFNGQLLIDSINYIYDENNDFIFEQNITNKNILVMLDYFLCNEKYMKAKNSEGNNYKDSKNYILKNKFKYDNKIQIKDIDLNKINNILKDIEYTQNNIDNNSNKYHVDIYSVENEKMYNNRKSCIRVGEPLNVNKIYLFSHINYNKFEYKLTNNIFLNDIINNDKHNEKIQNEVFNTKEDKPKKKLVGRPGDWYCRYCNNLNFSFRNACNICRMPKYCWI